MPHIEISPTQTQTYSIISNMFVWPRPSVDDIVCNTRSGMIYWNFILPEE